MSNREKWAELERKCQAFAQEFLENAAWAERAALHETARQWRQDAQKIRGIAKAYAQAAQEAQ